MLRCLPDYSVDLVVFVFAFVFVAPFPVIPLTAAVIPGEVIIITGMFHAVARIVLAFVVVPIMIITVVAIVESNSAPLRCGAGPDRRGSKKCGR